MRVFFPFNYYNKSHILTTRFLEKKHKKKNKAGGILPVLSFKKKFKKRNSALQQTQKIQDKKTEFSDPTTQEKDETHRAAKNKKKLDICVSQRQTADDSLPLAFPHSILPYSNSCKAGERRRLLFYARERSQQRVDREQKCTASLEKKKP